MSGLFSSVSSDSSLFSSYFGTSSNSSNSTSNLLGDYAMIKNGTYTKLLKKYYAENPVQRDENGKPSIASSKAADATKDLLSVKNSANKTSEAAAKLASTDTSKTSREDLLKSAKNFVENYNSMLDDLDNIESVTLLQNAVWLTKQTSANANVLSAVGIKIGADNKLSMDDKVFNEANDSAIKSAFSGSNSVIRSIAQRATQIYSMAGTQAVLNSKASSYNSSGAYNVLTSSSLINSLM